MEKKLVKIIYNFAILLNIWYYKKIIIKWRWGYGKFFISI